MANNSSTIISIYYGHNSTVALIENGKITECISEERFNRVKNTGGFPIAALEYVRSKIKAPVDYYVLTQQYPWGYLNLKKSNFDYSTKKSEWHREIPKLDWKNRLFTKAFYKRIKAPMLNAVLDISKNTDLKNEMEDYFSNLLKVPKSKILHIDHHLCHALSTNFFETNNNPKLIFTLDGEGDGSCATVGIFNGEYKLLSKVNKAYSPGYLYLEVTAYLGMKPNEHEFKVMGLAPYSRNPKRYLPIFEKILWLNDENEFESEIPMKEVGYYLVDNLPYGRFDDIAAGLQAFTENITLEWIRRWIKKTEIHDISFSGGVAMNVKMNQRIAEMSEVNSLTICPSAGDESTVLGGCFVGYFQFCKDKKIPCVIKQIKDLYLGTEYSEALIEKLLKDRKYSNKYNITKPKNINLTVAELLSKNEIVARFYGRMEFGARALGNRSILANPRSYENVRLINDMIKNRDFWMPFAASILEEDEGRYIINPKKIDASFMTITFDTTKEAQKDLIGALHPADKTSRPQIVKKDTSQGYHELISEFKKLTGIGGILNTSFNLHGEPNVESPKDAMYTFENSGLKYLALGPFLISK